MNLDQKIDRIYDKIDRLLCEGKFDIVDKILENIPTTHLCIDLLISFLVITLPAKTKLRNRAHFYIKVERNILWHYGRKNIDKLLAGLK